jgi:nicotinate-nucleotide pyrophosphorylase (carboxylating)
VTAVKEFTQWHWAPVLEDDCRQLVRLAIREDFDQSYDWTTVALVPEASHARAHIVARQPGIAAGLATIPVVLQEMDTPIQWQPARADGSPLQPRDPLGILFGPARDLLAAERLILNLLGRLSGIASLTRQYVSRVGGTRAQIYDTRKTCPGYRRLDKYAVLCGGGHNHRTGLFDAILIKDNHLAFGSSGPHRYTPAQAVQAARAFVQQSLPPEQSQTMIIEIEVDTLDQFQQVLPVQPDIILLDNMTLSQLRQAVEIRDAAGSDTQLEASGGVHLDTVRGIAETGVDRISVGALTHSAPCLDIGLDWLDADPGSAGRTVRP